jgi:hypothetical protein
MADHAPILSTHHPWVNSYESSLFSICLVNYESIHMKSVVSGLFHNWSISKYIFSNERKWKPCVNWLKMTSLQGGVTVKIQQVAVCGNYENPTNDAKGEDVSSIMSQFIWNLLFQVCSITDLYQSTFSLWSFFTCDNIYYQVTSLILTIFASQGLRYLNDSTPWIFIIVFVLYILRHCINIMFILQKNHINRLTFIFCIK